MWRLLLITLIIPNLLFIRFSRAEIKTKYHTHFVESCEGQVFKPLFNSDFCNLATFLLQNITPLNNPLSPLLEKPVVLLGDTHPNKLLKHWLIRNLASLKAAGFTHVGIEALNSESQDLLNKYKTDRSLRTEILKLIAADWNWIPQEHLDLIDAVYASGLELVLLDNRNELEKKGLGDKIQLRNEHMAEIIYSTLKSPQAGRIVVLTGKVHSALTDKNTGEMTLPEVLEVLDIPVQSIDLESGEQLVPPKHTQAFVQYLSKNTLPPSLSGDYYLPAPAGSVIHGIIFISK